MNSKGHFFISLVKSIIRIESAILALIYGKFEIFAWGIMLAEIGGILEEVFDRR